jgi:hypothetical protein
MLERRGKASVCGLQDSRAEKTTIIVVPIGLERHGEKTVIS